MSSDGGGPHIHVPTIVDTVVSDDGKVKTTKREVQCMDCYAILSTEYLTSKSR